MATHIWRGDAPAVAQVDTVQITGYDAATTYIIMINGKTVSVPGTTDANGTATALAAAWNASTIPEFEEITASASTDTVTLTADTAGVPFTAVSSVSGGGGTIGAVTNATANAGPNVWAANNFDSGALPANGDTVIVENSSSEILYGLDQSAVTLAVLTIRQSFTGKIGLPRSNANGYVEYRETFLAISATTINVGEGEGNGSGRIKLDTGANQAALNVHNKATRAETGIACLLWKGTHADNTLNVIKGDVGVAFFGGETATVATLKVGYLSNQSGDSSVVCGSGTTLTTVEVRGGQVELNSNVTTITQTGGSVNLRGSATVTTWNLDGGIAYYCSSGTATLINVGGGVLDFRRDMQARTVANLNAYQGAAIHDPFKTVTWTNGLDLHRCSPSEVTLNIGQHQTLTPSAI